MRLDRLSIGGFGRLSAGTVLKLAPGLNLVLAPNERGKTTLSHLIAGLFYGFGQRRAGVHPYEPWGGGDTGGEAVYHLDSGQSFTLSRHLDKREILTLRDEAGREVALNGQQPGELHLGLGQGAFLTVSRIGLEDLQQALYAGGVGKELENTRQWLSGYFFGEAATRGELANPVSVLQRWAAERERLYSDDRRRGGENKALAQRTAQAREALALAQGREAQIHQVRRELEELTQQGKELSAKRDAAAQAVREATKRLEQAQALARRDELLEKMEELAKQGLAVEADEARARDLHGRAESAAERARSAQSLAQQAREKAAELAPGGEPEALEAHLRGLQEMRSELNATHRMQEAVESDLNRQARALRDQWGLDAAALASIDPQTFQDVERLRGQARESERVNEAARITMMASLPESKHLPKWWMGAVIMAGLGAVTLLVLIFVLHLPWWYLAIVAGMALGGVALLLSWRARREYNKQAEEKLAQALAAAEEAEAKHAVTEQELAEAQEKLPPSLREAEIMAVSQALAEARRLEGELAVQARERAALEKKREALLAQAKQAAPLAAGGMEAALEEMRQNARQAQNSLAHAERLTEQAQREEESARSLEQELKQHLDALKLPDLEALAQARERGRQIDKLRAAVWELEQGMQASDLLTSHSPEVAGQTLEKLREEFAALDRKTQDLAVRRGELAGELDHLGKSESAAQAQARLDSLRQERVDLARRHDALLLAETILSRAMEEFRLEAQPGLLKKAGRYLAMATDGAYEWLGTDLFDAPTKGDPEISTRSGPGAPEREIIALSRGTRDQLYLCLRLALAEEITEKGESLPLILDDPLVNFDSTRLPATLRMLGRLAAERQVIMLTCHPHQAELLERECGAHPLEI